MLLGEIRLLVRDAYSFAMKKDMYLWQKLDMLMSRENQTRVGWSIVLLVPVLWLFNMPVLALLPVSITVWLHLYYGMFAGGCEGALLDIPFIVGIGMIPFGWVIAGLSFCISWPVLFGWLWGYKSFFQKKF